MKAMKTAFVITLWVLSFSAAAGEDTREAYVKAYEKAVANPLDESAGAGLAALLPKVKTSFGPPRDLYILEGDLPADNDDLVRYRLQKSASGSPAQDNSELIVHVESGKLARWAAGQQTLRYAIVKSTFPNEANYQAVIEDMKNSGQDWQSACQQCSIIFEHKPAYDAISTWDEFQALADSDELRFIIVFNPDTSGPIASAFFPSDTWDERMVSIFPDYFALSGGYTARGVLRHELGHVLGYRHEHTRNIAGCTFEDNNWAPVTPYDPKSVMHYWCGDAGTRELDISDVDRAGHATNYALQAPNDPQPASPTPQ